MVKPATPRAAITLTIITGLILITSGCGKTNPTTTTTAASSSSTSKNTASQKQTKTTQSTPAPAPIVEKVEPSSPAFPNEGKIPTRYTCDGANEPPPIHWKGIPPGTVELMLDILAIRPVNGKLYYDWGVTGLSPTSHGITNGKLPPGAIIGTNTAGQVKYSLCPQRRGVNENYVVVLSALTHKLPVKTGYDDATLRNRAYENSKYEGFLFFKYKG